MATVMKESVEDRVARLESDVAHIRSDIGEIKLDIRELRAAVGGLRDEMIKGDNSPSDAVAQLREEIVRSFRDRRTRMYVLGGVILTAMARGFHWI